MEDDGGKMMVVAVMVVHNLIVAWLRTEKGAMSGFMVEVSWLLGGVMKDGGLVEKIGIKL